MNHPFIRFVSAILLGIVTSIVIRTVCLVCFSAIVGFFAYFSFKTLFLTSMVCSIGGWLLLFIASLLFTGLHWAGKGSKWIAALPILIFFNNFIGDCIFFFTDGVYYGPHSEELLTFLREGAGSLYIPGAILTIIVMLACYIAAGVALLNKDID